MFARGSHFLTNQSVKNVGTIPLVLDGLGVFQKSLEYGLRITVLWQLISSS
jgi:hypothetical protein